MKPNLDNFEDGMPSSHTPSLLPLCHLDQMLFPAYVKLKYINDSLIMNTIELVTTLCSHKKGTFHHALMSVFFTNFIL